MPEYILYDLEGRKHIYLHMIDVRTALATGLYTAERPELKRDKKISAESKPTSKTKFNITDIETKKTSTEKMWDEVKTKSDIEKMEEKTKEKK